MDHIYNCEELNSDDNMHNNIPYEEIFKDNIEKQIEISRIFFNNMKNREKQNNQLSKENVSHVIQRDPLCSVMEQSNGL